MRYAIFTDVHANLEALEAVLASIDKLARDEPIDQIWFLGDLVGYGPNPNECIQKLRERTDVIIAGNHDWAAVGKISLEDFSEAARISAEWTAEQLTEEHRQFLSDLPEHIDMEQADCVLVHGSPYGPLWEYLTSEVLAERSFDCFVTRYCFVGHTHVPIIFQQPEEITNIPTVPLSDNGHLLSDGFDTEEDDEETTELAAIRPAPLSNQAAAQYDQAHGEPESEPVITAVEEIDTTAEEAPEGITDTPPETPEAPDAEETSETRVTESTPEEGEQTEVEAIPEDQETDQGEQPEEGNEEEAKEESSPEMDEHSTELLEITPEDAIHNAEERLNEEIEELLSLLGLSQGLVRVNNEMVIPPEGDWQAPEHYRAIINPGGVGQPRDGDPRAAFMIYDTERGFTFYRVPYEIEKTQEKIINAGLPPYLATRLKFGR
ncbi:MAG: metallophosphoesterase family protein [Ktedonobacteraceae bacterium]|nr:metallophosphoesterase family protein [Ktedonobacteraceae bacterium]